MEQNNFLRLPNGLRDTRCRAWFGEDSGYYSYESPLHCLYHLFDVLDSLRRNFTEINVWVLSQLMVTRPFTAAWDERIARENDMYLILGHGMFALDDRHVYDIVHALSMGCPAEYKLTRGEVIEEWRLYCARGGEV